MALPLIDLQCEINELDDLEALDFARRRGLTVEELSDLIDRRIARREERRRVGYVARVNVRYLRERQRTERQRPEAALVRDAWRNR
jgi:hypothetical protein